MMSDVPRPFEVVGFLGFLQVQAEAALLLSEGLGRTFVKVPTENDVVGQDLNASLELVNAGNADAAILNAMRLAMLGRDLRLLADERSKAFKVMQARLNTANRETYFGYRFEVAVGASLTRHGVDFEYDLPCEPDFVCEGGAGLECTSAHLASGSRTKTMTKLRRAVLDKASKPYCHAGTGLLVDYTSVFHRDITLDKSAVRGIGAATRTKAPFGSLIGMTMIWNGEGSQLQRGYSRDDAREVPPALAQLLDRVWPTPGGFTVDDVIGLPYN